MSRRVTMADIAREAGVSLMTVSRAINNKTSVSATTRARVQSIAERLGYRPSGIARSLATARTRTVGLVVVDNANPFFSGIARGVEHTAYLSGYSVFLCNTEEDLARERDVLRSLEENRVDGVVLCSSRLPQNDLLVAVAGFGAAVLINRQLFADGGLGTVLVNDEDGAHAITRHLLNRGHERIGFLSGPQNSYSGQQRGLGYRAALRENDIQPNPGWEQFCLPRVDSGYAAAHALLSAHDDLTALFCYNDLSAIGALQAAKALGRRVPDDLAIAGFDDTPLAALVTPALTTCRVPVYDMGRAAMKLLIDRMNGCRTDCKDAFFSPHLVIRESAP